MPGLTQNKTGRPKGKKDSKQRKPRSDTKAAAKKRSEAAKKAAKTRRRQRAEKEQKLKPEIEIPKVEVTPYPRAGDSPEFKDFIEETRLKAEQEKAQRESERIKESKPIEPAELLKAQDVAEWVAWPFLMWAQANNMKSLLLTDAEAINLAEPLTSILNRHGVGDLIPPDLLDGLQFAARSTPVMTFRFGQIKAERQKRGEQGGSREPGWTGEQGGSPPVQGAPVSKPKEV